MRKDVKLGFAIGGILLAVLIVYVLVVPERDPSSSSSSSSDVQLVGADGKPIVATPTPAPDEKTAPDENEVVAVPPAQPQPADANAGEEIPERDGGIASSATPDSDANSAAPVEARNDVDWDALLGGGGGEVLMTSTPVALDSADADTDTSTETPTINPQPQVIDASGLTARDAAEPPLPPTTRPSAANAGPRNHVVRSGETLSSIAKAAYGSANFYPYIQRANPGLDPKHLKVGATITLPPIDDVVPQASAGAVDSSKPIDASSEYRVQSGDSLYSISMRLYGSAERMGEIYELNKQAIGPDPGKLKLNMILKLPAAPAARTAAR